jgi:hypothetical protein
MIIAVPNELIERAQKFGRDMVRSYAANPSSRSASVTGKWGAEKNPVLQTRGKIGEIAAALFFGIESNINWRADRDGDGGVDLVTPRGYRVDVKTTQPHRRLIWSAAVNHLFWDASKVFDILLSATVSDSDQSHCRLDGWIGKEGFFVLKKISDGSDGLTAGTWNYPKERLADVHLLIDGPLMYFCEDCGRYACFSRRDRWFCAKHWRMQ